MKTVFPENAEFLTETEEITEELDYRVVALSIVRQIYVYRLQLIINVMNIVLQLPNVV